MLKDIQASGRTNALNKTIPLFISLYGCKYKKMKSIHQINNKGYLWVTFLRGVRVFVSQRKFLLSLSYSNLWSIPLNFKNSIKAKAHIEVSCIIPKSALYTVVLNES